MTDKQIKYAYKSTLDEIEQNLKNIHYPLCNMEKYAFDYETDEVDEEVQNIHKGYMQIYSIYNRYTSNSRRSNRYGL